MRSWAHREIITPENRQGQRRVSILQSENHKYTSQACSRLGGGNRVLGTWEPETPEHMGRKTEQTVHRVTRWKLKQPSGTWQPGHLCGLPGRCRDGNINTEAICWRDGLLCSKWLLFSLLWSVGCPQGPAFVPKLWSWSGTSVSCCSLFILFLDSFIYSFIHTCAEHHCMTCLREALSDCAVQQCMWT